MEICPAGAKLFHANRHNEANSRFSQFCEHAYKTPITACYLIWRYPICSLSVQWTAFPAYLCVSCGHEKNTKRRNEVYTTGLRGPTVNLILLRKRRLAKVYHKRRNDKQWCPCFSHIWLIQVIMTMLRCNWTEAGIWEHFIFSVIIVITNRDISRIVWEASVLGNVTRVTAILTVNLFL